MVVEGVKYLEENCEKDGVNSIEFGLQFCVLMQGEGVILVCIDCVCVYYIGKFIDGIVFDSFVVCGELVEFLVNGVIVGWIEVLILMLVGFKWELIILQELVYGECGVGVFVLLFSILVFEVELLEIF